MCVRFLSLYYPFPLRYWPRTRTCTDRRHSGVFPEHHKSRSSCNNSLHFPVRLIASSLSISPTPMRDNCTVLYPPTKRILVSRLFECATATVFRWIHVSDRVAPSRAHISSLVLFDTDFEGYAERNAGREGSTVSNLNSTSSLPFIAQFAFSSRSAITYGMASLNSTRNRQTHHIVENKTEIGPVVM